MDQVTGAEYLCSRLATAHRPCLFEFEHLLSNHAYDVVMIASSGVQGGPGDSQSVLWGSFTTLCAPRVPSIQTFSGASSDLQVAQSLRHATGGGGGSVTGSIAMSEEGSLMGRSGNHASSSVRLLLLGADKPSWRRKLTHSAGFAGSASIDRQSLARGVHLCQEVSNVLSQGWSGIDVVVHCGLSVDWNSCVDGVLNLLTQAENLQGLYTGALSSSNYAVRSNNLPVMFAPGLTSTRHILNYSLQTEEHDSSHGVTAHSLLLRAFEQLRGAYLRHWGTSPHTSNLLAHGNHYFLSSPVFDLLTLFHAVSLRDLRRDLSPFCVLNLTQFISQLQLEYQHQLSSPAQSITLQGNMDGTRPSGDLDRSASIPYLKLLDGGAVAMFELRPDFSFQHDSLNRVSDHLISSEQVQALDSLLFPTVPGNHDGPPAGQQRVFAKTSLTTVVLLSPIPLVLDSDTFTEFSHLNAQQKGIRFAHQEVIQLLDLLSQWVEVNSVEREVLIITGGVATSFITTIHCDHISRLQAQKGARRPQLPSSHSLHHSASPRHPHGDSGAHLHESSLHSGVSPNPSHAVKIRQMCCGALVGIHEDSLPHSEGVLHSAERRFKFSHRACANGSGAEIIESAGDTRPHTAATSGTAAAIAAAEAARAADYYPQCGVVEILTGESRSHFHPSRPPQTNILHAQHSLEHSLHEPSTAVSAPAVLKFLDQAGLRSYFSHGWPAHIGGSEGSNKISAAVKSGASVALSLQGKSPDGGGSSHSILQHSRLPASVQLHHLAAELQTHLFLASAVKGQPVDAFVAEIKRAMGVICTRERSLFEECHRIYLQHDTFPLPVSGNFNVEKCFLSMTHWIIRRMGAATRSACKVPSSFIVRLVWEHYEKEAEKLIKPAQDSMRSGGENVVAEFVSASMAGDVEYFIRLVRNCLELQIVQEYMSYSRGLLDGSER